MYTQHVYPVRLGLVFAILMFAGVLVITLLTRYHYGGMMFKLLEDTYPGCHHKSGWGIMACAVMGSIDGFVGGALIGVLYNLLDVSF